MKLCLLIPLLALFIGACGGPRPYTSSRIQQQAELKPDQLLLFNFGSSLRIKNSQVSIVIRRDGTMRIVAKSKGEEEKKHDKILTSEEIKHLQSRIAAVEWK